MPECFSSSLSFSSIATVKQIAAALALEGLPTRSGSRIWQVSRLVARPREWPPVRSRQPSPDARPETTVSGANSAGLRRPRPQE